MFSLPRPPPEKNPGSIPDGIRASIRSHVRTSKKVKKSLTKKIIVPQSMYDEYVVIGYNLKLLKRIDYKIKWENILSLVDPTKNWGRVAPMFAHKKLRKGVTFFRMMWACSCIFHHGWTAIHHLCGGSIMTSSFRRAIIIPTLGKLSPPWFNSFASGPHMILPWSELSLTWFLR